MSTLHGAKALAEWLRGRAEVAPDERRKTPRGPLDTEALVIPLDAKGHPMPARRRAAIVVDISQGGSRLVSNARIPVGRALVRVGPYGKGIEVPCRVLACEPRRGDLFVVRIAFAKKAA